MSRPMGHQLLATQPMEVVALDFLSMPYARGGVWVAVRVIVCQLTRVAIYGTRRQSRQQRFSSIAGFLSGSNISDLRQRNTLPCSKR
jgi:hypothetical protein